jgi:hypothetical protein
VSIGSDAVYAAEEFIATGVKTGKTCIETISCVTALSLTHACARARALSLCVFLLSFFCRAPWIHTDGVTHTLTLPTTHTHARARRYGYGAQAVVISVDPRRVYVADPAAVKHHTIATTVKGPNGEGHCWYQCTVKGGREGRDIGAYEFTRACEALGTVRVFRQSLTPDECHWFPRLLA